MSLSTMLEKLRSDVEEKKRALSKVLDSLLEKYDAGDQSLVPSAVAEQVPSAKATADLEAALRKVSTLEMQNKTLQERLKEKEEKAKQLHDEKVKSDVERQHSEELTNNLLEELQKIKSDTETTKSLFTSEIKRLEGELKAADVKYKRANSKNAKQAFEEDSSFKKNEQAHLETVNQLTMRINELEKKQGLQHEVSRAESMDQAAPTEELEPAQEDEDLRQKLMQEQLANAGAKTLHAKLRDEIERLQKRLNEEIQSKNDLKAYIRKLEEGRDVQPNTARQQQPQPNTDRQQQPQPNTARQQQPQPNTARQQQPQPNTDRQQQPQPNTDRQQQPQPNTARQQQPQPNTARQQQPQPTNAAPRPQQERTQRLLDQEIQSHKSTKSLVQRLEDENNRLKESLKNQEQHTGNASRQNQLKKERQRYDELLKVYNKEVEESKELKNKVNVLTCRLRQRDSKNGHIKNTREAVVMTADQECQSEGSVLDLEEVKISEEKLKLYYQNQLYMMYAENDRLLARLHNSERYINDIQLHFRRSKKQLQRDTKKLRSQLQTEQQKFHCLMLSLDKSKKVEEDKWALEKTVATLRSELNREKCKGLARVKELEKRLEDERNVFRTTIAKCSAAYHAVAAKTV